MEGINILVCEDERLFALELKERLEKMGHVVVGLAASGPEAVAIARDRKPDLALMDVALDGPVLGTAVADSLARNFDIPSIFVTAFADSETISDAHRSHPLAYLVKPISDRELEMAIEFGMAQHRMREALREELENYRTIVGRLGVLADSKTFKSKGGEMPQVMMMMEELGGVIGHIAHHLNNSLAGVMGYLEWLTSCSTLQEFEKRYVQGALEQCQQQKTFVQRLLWASQEGPRQLGVLSVRELVDEALETAGKLLRPDVKIDRSIVDQDLAIFADREATKNALSGVIVNASDASSSGDRIVVSADREYVERPEYKNPRAVPDSYVVISVRDHGVGMTKDQIKEVCAPFVTSHPSPNVTGLGLSVAYGVTQAHGGWLDIESELGRGTSVKLYLPLVGSH